MANRSDAIAVRAVTPASELVYRQFLVASLLMATLVGFVLAIHVPLGRLLDAGQAERTTDLIQAHGQVQLLGFAGLYVIGMSLRLLPRFASARLAFESLVPLTLWGLVAALIARAVVMPWTSGDTHDAWLLASAVAILAASASFFLVIVATLAYDARRPDASSFAFGLGAATLFAASVAALVATIDAVEAGSRALPYLANHAIVQLQLSGFILVFITGVALRALPVMVGIERPRQGARFVPVALAATVATLAAALLYLEYASFSTAVVRVADAAFLLMGVTLLGFVWQVGVLRPAANRIRPSSQVHLWLIRSAFVWLVVAAAVTVYTGGAAFVEGDLVSQSEFDAARHALGAGVITNLILGMSLMILPEFAVERQQPNRQREMALLLAVLVNLATLLRVVPALADDAWTADERDLSMAIAGSLAEAAMLIFAFYLLRLIWRTRQA